MNRTQMQLFTAPIVNHSPKISIAPGLKPVLQYHIKAAPPAMNNANTATGITKQITTAVPPAFFAFFTIVALHSPAQQIVYRSNRYIAPCTNTPVAI